MNYTHEWICCLWLALMLPDCSPRYMQLVEEYGAAVTVFENFEDIHKENPSLIRQVELERMRKTSPEQLFHRFENTLQKLKVDVIFLNSDEYPSILKQISSPPNVLFVRGKMPNEEALTVGIVGSRKCTSYGVEATRNIAYSLAEGGACIVSGLAEGIDAHASSAALECKSNSCPTVAVLGSGIDVVFPKCNESLYHAIIERGAVISQFCPNAQTCKLYFSKAQQGNCGAFTLFDSIRSSKGQRRLNYSRLCRQIRKKGILHTRAHYGLAERRLKHAYKFEKSNPAVIYRAGD